MERNDRNRHGGGVCVYIRSDIAYNRRMDLHQDHLETLWIDILLPKSKPILVGTCYRTEDKNSFFSDLETCYEGSSDSETIILGDFNADVRKPQESIVKSLKHFCYVFDFRQLIQQPTRVTPNSESTIDLIMVSDRQNISQHGVIPFGLSDHYMTYCSRKVSKAQIGRHNTIKIRSLKNYTTSIFIDKLNAVSWSNVTNCVDVETSWSNFKSNLTSVIDDVAPEKTIRAKQRSEPWFTSEIRELILQRDKVLKEFNKTKDPSLYSQFKILRNKVQYEISKAKTHYYKDKVEDNKNDPKKLWRILNDLGTGKGKGNTSNSSRIGLNIEGEICFDKSKVAESFNNFFVTIASSLVNLLPSVSGKFGFDFVSIFLKTKICPTKHLSSYFCY